MRFLIIDLEATCWENATIEQRKQMEMIEIGCAVVEPYSLKLLDQLDIIVKPTKHPELTQFCVNLTSITQEMVSNGTIFQRAMEQLAAFVKDDDIFCSWGLFDCKMFHRQCEEYDIEYPFKNGHANIKNVVAQAVGHHSRSLIRECGFFGLDFSGRLHRGIDDALNMRVVLEKADDHLQKKDEGVTMTSLIVEAAERSKETKGYPFFNDYYGQV